MLKKIAMVLSLNVCRVTSLPEDCSPHDVHIAYIAGRSWGRVDIWVLGLEPWWNTDLDPGPGRSCWWCLSAAADLESSMVGWSCCKWLEEIWGKELLVQGGLVLMYWYFFAFLGGIHWNIWKLVVYSFTL